MNVSLRVIEGSDDQEGPSDDALMLLARAGDTRAFGRLVSRYERRIIRFCSYLCRRPEQAREIAQEVFLRIWKARDRYRAEGRFAAWAFTIARNLCRRARARARIEALFVPEAPEPVLGEDGERRQMHALTRASLLSLEPKFREALLLRYVEDLPYEDIARALGLNESTARSRVH